MLGLEGGALVRDVLDGVYVSLYAAVACACNGSKVGHGFM